ncbi:MAG: MFS transporter, partial [Candidatus Korarchaeota archaeon]|nr:MFS transporter [Candidatus Korarchaeota archaeon]
GSIAAHKGAVEFGALMAVFMLFRAPIAAFSGTLSDLFGRKAMILVGMVLYTLTSFGMLLVDDVLGLIIMRALTGVASGITWPVAEAYLADVTTPSERGKAISLYVMTQNLGDIVGPGIGAGVYKLYVEFFGPSDYVFALKTPFIVMALLSLVATGLAAALPKVVASTASKLSTGVREVIAVIRSLPKDVARSIKTIYINGAANGVAMGIMNTALIVFAVEKVVKDPAIIGLAFTIMGVAALPTTFLSGYLSDRFERRKPFVLLSYLISRPVVFLMPFITDVVGLLVILIAFMMAFSVGMPVMRALQSELVGQEVRGTIFGVQQLFFNAGVVGGAMFGSYLVAVYAPTTVNILGFELTGYIVPFWAAGILTVLTTILFALYVVEPEVRL